MSLKDYKITDSDVSTKGVVNAPDKLTGTAAENKAVFDRLIREAVKDKFNDLIDELVEEITAKMDAPASMGEVGQYLRVGIGGIEWGTPEGGGDMLMSVYDTDEDGRVDEADEALTCSGNAATATKLKTARTLTIKDNGQTHAGAAVSFDGSGNVILRLPSTIAADFIGALTGNADTATKLKTARTLTIKDSSQAHAGTAVSFDGSGNIILRLPSTIAASLVGDVTGSVSGSSGSTTGNAATATQLKTARNITIKDNSQEHSGGAVSFNGTSAITLKLPATIKANLEAGTIVLDSNSYGNNTPAAGTPGRLFFKRA